MVDFRKWFPALAVVALAFGAASTANAQQVAAFSCIGNAGVPPIVRAEGLTELVGDLVLNCNGGISTPAGAAVPQANVQIFLNTNVTSRITASDWSEALLMIDEPGPTAIQPDYVGARTARPQQLRRREGVGMFDITAQSERAADEPSALRYGCGLCGATRAFSIPCSTGARWLTDIGPCPAMIQPTTPQRAALSRARRLFNATLCADRWDREVWASSGWLGMKSWSRK